MPALDPSIAGGLQPTTQLASPLQSIGALMQLRGQMSEIALRNQQIEQSRQQIEQSKQAAENLRQEAAVRQRNVESTQRMTKVLQDPNTHIQIQAGNLQPLWDAGVSPDVALPALDNLSKFYQQAATLKTTKADYYSKARGQIADTLGAIDLNDPNAAAHLNSFRDAFSKQFPEYASHLPQFLEGPGLKEQVDNAIANNAVGKAIIDAHLTQGKERAQTEEAQALTKKNTAEAGKAQFELDLMKGAAAGDEDRIIDARFAGNPEAAAAAKLAYQDNLKGGIKAATDAVNHVYDTFIGDAKKADSLIPAEVKKADALVPSEVRRGVATAVATHQAIAKLSPDAFAQIANPTSQTAAMREADQIYKDFTDKSSTNQQFIDTLNGARHNPVLAATIPMQEVKAFFSRANQSELKAVSSGVGSIFQRADTFFEKGAKGTPPDWLIDDTLALAQLQQQTARRNFDAGRERLKMRGVDISKLPEPSTGSATPAVVKWGRDAHGNPVPLGQ